MIVPGAASHAHWVGDRAAGHEAFIKLMAPLVERSYERLGACPWASAGKARPKAKPKTSDEKRGRTIGQLKLIAVIALVAGVIKAGQYAGRHLVPLILVLVSAAVLIALAVRPVSALVNRFGARFIVRSWAPVTAPQARRARGLPDRSLRMHRPRRSPAPSLPGRLPGTHSKCVPGA